MSSAMDGGYLIGAAVALPLVAAFGAGWAAWQAGKLAVEGVIAVNEYVDEKVRRQKLEEAQRLSAAVSGRGQITGLCDRAIAEFESEIRSGKAGESAKETIAELKRIRSAPLGDAGQLENRNLADRAKLESILGRRDRQRSADTRAENSAVSAQLKSMRVAFEAAVINASRGENVTAPDPEVRERVTLTAKLYEIAGRAVGALDEIKDITERCGLSKSNATWFRSLFNGVDADIGRLLSPSSSNGDVRDGIARLEEIMKQYDAMRPTIMRDVEKTLVLYPIYKQACEALMVEAEDIRSFDTAKELEDRMEELAAMKEKADALAETYRALGAAAYVSLAVDTELQRMGYHVLEKEGVTAMTATGNGAAADPTYAKIDGVEIPFFEWGGKGMTQLYSVSGDVSLQLVVNEDGSLSMQTIGGEGAPANSVRAAQKSHCQMMKSLRRSLLENWFISSGCDERIGPDAVLYAAEWRTDERNVWTAEAETGRRSETKQEQLAMKMK